MNSIDLSSPMRQSRKGILIIFAYRLFSFVKKTFIFFIASLFTLLKKESFGAIKPIYILLAVGLILVLLLVVAILRYFHFKFFLKNGEFHLKTGILNKETIILSKSKIQNIYIKESFLHRLIGVVSLNIESAGDKSSEIEIPAIDKPIANAIKKQLFESGMVEETTVEPTAKVFYHVPLKKLILEGLTQNHFKSLMVILTFFVGLYYENKEFVKAYDLEEKVANWLHLDDELLANLVLVNGFLLIAGLLISMIVSTVKMVVQNFDLKVMEHQKTLEISKGLIQTMTLTLTPSRIQNLVISTNRIKQKLGLHSMAVKQAMVNEKQANNFSIVGLNVDSLKRLTTMLASDYIERDLTNRQQPDIFYKRILAIRYGFFGLLANLILLNAIQWGVILSILLTIGIIVFCVNKTFKKTYLYFDDQYITKGSGLIETRTNIMALHKIQSVASIQNIFQKKRALASLQLTTASQKLIIPYIKKQEADLIVDYLLFKLESQDKDWM